MTEKSLKYLSDILMAIDLIEEFTSSISDFNIYVSDRKTQSAVERQLAIIGEALNKFYQSGTMIKIENDTQIIAFRNRLVHAYDSIDNSIVWAIIKKHVPQLKEEINKINQAG
jgi:uncharacterized protein with HEPN domain